LGIKKLRDASICESYVACDNDFYDGVAIKERFWVCIWRLGLLGLLIYIYF